MKRIYATAMLAAFFAMTAGAQDGDLQKQKDELNQITNEITNMRVKVIGMVGGVMSNVKNAPFRADQVTETTQTLGDGTRIHNEHQVTIYRDSQGRVRRETPEEISIMDPVSGVDYVLQPKDMTYRKMGVSVSVSSGSAEGRGLVAVRQLPAVIADGGGTNMPMFFSQRVTEGPNVASFSIKSDTVTVTPKKESLGTQTMEGVNAQGEQRTSTIEAGAIGNDRPIQIVSEHWYSPDLQMDVMTRHSDPRTGEEIMRLTNINRAEPDPSMFQVPAGYQPIEGRGGRGVRGGGQ
jgi:hypothetical protein